MADALLTVLMPVYNAGRFLKEAIDSILGQTLKEFQFLIIDDGSTDGSIGIINSYNDPRIRLVQNEKNLGISATLNKGIELSNTELIARMDADDISYPSRLEKQYRYFQENKDCVLLSTWAREITEEGETIIVEEYKNDHHYYALNFECWIYHPTVMYKRSAVMEVGMYVDFYSEDFDLWWKLTRKYKMACLMEVLLDYRHSNEGISRVERRREYQEAHHNQVIRNIRYYAGKDFTVSYEDIEAYRYNFDPILKSGDLNAFINCIKRLNVINKRILKSKEVYHNWEATKEISDYKMEVVISTLSQNLPKRKKVYLYLASNRWGKVFDVLINMLLRIGKKTFNFRR